MSCRNPVKKKTGVIAKAPITMKIDKRLVYDAANKQPTDIAQRDALALGFVYTTHVCGWRDAAA